MSAMARLRTNDTGWVVNFAHGMLEVIPDDFALVLLIDGAVNVRIEQDAEFRKSGDTSVSVVCGGPDDSPPWAPDARVSRLDIHRSGHLGVVFADGANISVDPDLAYESYQIRQIDPAYVDGLFDADGYALRPSDDGSSVITTSGPSGFGFAFVGAPSGGVVAWTKDALTP